MSASEKLRALEKALAQATRIEIEGAPAPMALLNLVPVLPQIRALVEATEIVTYYGQAEHRFNEWYGSELLNSLAALDDALREQA